MSFEQAFQFTKSEEGGFSDNPADSGGATMHGVTQRVYDDYRDSMKASHQSVELITDAECRAIYEEMYWIPGKCPQMHEPLAVAHFDWCFNHGVPGAIKTLQAALGVEADGIFGKQTASALALADSVETAQAYNILRREWYKNRVAQRPDQAIFIKGWLGRVDRLDAYMEKL